MKKDAIYEGTREVRTFVDLYHGAYVLLKKSRSDKRGSYFTTMGSLLLTAFTFEAYLNHIGEKKIEFWKNIERIRLWEKYEALCTVLKLSPDFGKRPYQTLKLLFRFRNSIAHGRSIVLKIAEDVPLTDEPWDYGPKTDWEEFCTIKTAETAYEDTGKVITEIHKASGFGNSPFIGGLTIGSIRRK